jgi:hypothetical protein
MLKKESLLDKKNEKRLEYINKSLSISIIDWIGFLLILI